MTEQKTSLGYRALVDLYHLKVIPHYRWSYAVEQGRKKMIMEDGIEIHLYPREYLGQMPSTALQQLEFALKHEGLNLGIILAFFNKISTNDLELYLKEQPSGKAQRKIWFVYETFFEKRLNLPDLPATGNYFDLLEDEDYYTTAPIKNARCRINDNLLGNKNFCPFVRKTAKLKEFEQQQLDKQLTDLLAQYPRKITERAVQYLFIKETESSWEIEREIPSTQKTERFAHLLKRAGQTPKMDKETLVKLQHQIVEPIYAEGDYRHSQNFVMERVGFYEIKVHYVSPREEDVSVLMEGLLQSLQRMMLSHVSPVVTAAAISFGFVFIHPFEDGNGRLHRFLIHYILTRGGYTPEGTIFPVSAVMVKNRKLYDEILETASAPLMALLKHAFKEDRSLHVEGNEASLYAYFDYTQFAEYLYSCIQKTIEEELAPELRFLTHYDRAKHAVEEIIVMPDKEVDLMIMSIVQNRGKLSKNKREKFFIKLTDDQVHRMELAIQQAMDIKPQ